MNSNRVDKTTIENDGDRPGRNQLAGTTVEGVAAAAGGSLLSLPGSLRDRYEIVEELPAGNQGTPLKVRNKETGELRLIKVHHVSPPDGYGEILDSLAQGSHEHIVQIYDHRQEERFWEEQEYCEGGSLKDFFQAGAIADESRQSDIIREVSTALDHLHSLSPPDSDTRWVHRDVKPENILVRSEDPFDLVLCDFGLAQLIQGSRVDGSRSGTYLYAAPEVINLDSTSPARDWWALGMIVIEMATGRHPFISDDGIAFSLEEISYSIGVRQVDTSSITDPRLRNLAQGLLIRDPDKRWSGDQIAAWLNGEDPALEDVEGAFGPGTRRRSTIPFDFVDPETGQTVPYTDPSLLAAAMTIAWDDAAEIIFGGSEKRREQRALRDFVKSCGLDPEVRDEALEQLAAGSRVDLNRQLFTFLRLIAPELPPNFKGTLLNPASLATLAADAVGSEDRTTKERSIESIRQIHDDEPMRILAAEGGKDDLVDLERRWNRLAAFATDQVMKLAATLRQTPHSEVPPDRELRDSALALALLLAADPTQRTALTERLRQMRSGDAARIPAWASVADTALGEGATTPAG